MLALAAFVIFLVGLIVHLVQAGLVLDDVTFYLLLGLTVLALSRVYDRPLNRA